MTQTTRTEDESLRCRVCLDNEGIIPIFGDGSNPDISVNLMAFGTIRVQKSDDFPKLICSECFTLLDGAVTFRKTAIRSDTLLKQRQKFNDHPTMPVKIEVEFLTNENETILTQPVYYPPPANKKENTNLEMELEYGKYLDVTATKDDDDKSLMMIAKEKATTVKDESLKINPGEVNIQPFGLQLKTKTTNVLKKNKIVIISKGKIKTEITHQPTAEVSTDMQCKICKIPISKKKYSIHMRTAHNIKKSTNAKPKLCLKCNKLFHIEHFSKHMREVHAEDKNPRYHKPYKCEICFMDFTENTFARHVREVHNLTPNIPPKTKECPVCKKVFHRNYLGRHIRVIHKGEKKPKHRVECPICKTFFNENYYKVHAKTHEVGRKNYMCDVCGKEFLFQSVLANHKLIHSNEFPFKCDHCPYRGRSKHLLQIHSRTHAEEYPYKCDQCNKRCITKSKLNRHMREHKNAVDFVCDTCNKGFFTKLELERHVSVTHLGIRNHLCNLCGAAFGYKQGLSKHMRKVHKIRKFKGKNCTYLKIQE